MEREQMQQPSWCLFVGTHARSNAVETVPKSTNDRVSTVVGLFLWMGSSITAQLARVYISSLTHSLTHLLFFVHTISFQCYFPFLTSYRLQNDPPSGVTGAPMDTNIMLWQAVIFGPDDTPWEGGTFKLVLEFSEDYPNKAPQVRFLTKMFHPNIYNDGQICLDILQNQWSPIYDISAILTSIQSLLCDPNPASPANSEASRLYNENRREYNRRVREIVEQSWVDESWLPCFVVSHSNTQNQSTKGFLLLYCIRTRVGCFIGSNARNMEMRNEN